jgi:hypothetical protein
LEKLFTVTLEWLREFRSANGGYAKKQLTAIGVPWPPVAGWPRDVIGRSITDRERMEFEKGRKGLT